MEDTYCYSGPGFNYKAVGRANPGDYFDILGIDDDITWIDDDIVYKIDYFFQHLGGHIQQKSHPAGDTLQIPDMAHRSRQFYMAHALPPNFRSGNFHPAAIADYSAMPYPFILAAVTLPVFDGTKNSFAEKTILFRLLGTIVDGFRFGNQTM